MVRCLLAAEADQIQDFVFNASHLRQVVGGSQLLARFCREGADALLEHYGGDPVSDIVIRDGGGFRVLFQAEDSEVAMERARRFGSDLATLYRRCVGGTLTVADPVPYDGDFRQVSKAAHGALRKAKAQGDKPGVAAHLPYLAFCTSCGTAIANLHDARHTDERPNYLCFICQRKETERDAEWKRLNTGDLSGFLGSFRQAVEEICELSVPTVKLPQDADDVGKLDPRNYVAYLIADGNGMGRWFSHCNQTQMTALSESLTDVLRRSLATPCPLLLRRIAEEAPGDVRSRSLPVLPLILGGDDLFALLPARWALDFAAHFCRSFEERMQRKLRDPIGLLNSEDDGSGTPTMAAAVVVCKSSYPYRLAHRRGLDLLKQAKEHARRLELEEQRWVSTLGFTVISGNQREETAELDQQRYFPTLVPYFVREAADEVLARKGLPIQCLLKHRLALRGLPGKRRSELESLYDVTRVSELSDSNRLKDWQRQLDVLLTRIGRSPTLQNKVEEALQVLGNPDRERAYWRYREDLSRGHGLPDLLEVWDFSYQLDKPLTDYEEA